MATPKMLSRDFILSFFAQFSFSAVFCLLIPTIPIYLSQRGSTEIEIGILVGILSISSLFFRPFVGKALLKIPEKKFMIAGTLLYTLSSVAYLFAPPFWPILTVRLLQGIGAAFFSTAAFTLVARITPESHRGQILSYYFVAINVAFALAPFFGMLLINQFSFNALFLVCTGLSVCSLLVTLKLGKGQGAPAADPAETNQPFLSREALPPSIMAFLVNIIWGTVSAFFPLYALRCGVTNPGLFFGALALIHVFGRAFGGKILDLYDREKIMFPCLLAYIAGMAMFAFSKTLPMFILVAVVWGIGNAFLYPTLVAFALDRAGASQGLAMGTFTAISDLGAGIGPVIMGFLLELTSYRWMFVGLAVTGVLNLQYFLFFVKKKQAPSLS